MIVADVKNIRLFGLQNFSCQKLKFCEICWFSAVFLTSVCIHGDPHDQDISPICIKYIWHCLCGIIIECTERNYVHPAHWIHNRVFSKLCNAWMCLVGKQVPAAMFAWSMYVARHVTTSLAVLNHYKVTRYCSLKFSKKSSFCFNLFEDLQHGWMLNIATLSTNCLFYYVCGVSVCCSGHVTTCLSPLYCCKLTRYCF